MSLKRAVRIVFGILFLAVFIIVSYIRYDYSPKTNDTLDAAPAAPAAAVSTPAPAEEPAVTGTQLTGENIPPLEEVAQAEPVEEAQPPEEDDNLPDIDVTSWEFMLANPTHNIEAYVPNVYTVETVEVDARIADALAAFAKAARDEGLSVYLSSGYRDYNTQNYLFNRKMEQGYTREQAATIVAPPGTSEHQTGLACDITDRYYELKDSSLENTATYQWMSQHCQEYGFIVRYPKDKSGSSTADALDSVTGIIYEPWHFRYVGVEAATYIMENNLCLEEFLALYGVE